MANRVDLTNNKGSFDVTIPQEGKYRLSVKAYDDKDQLVDNGFLIHQSRTSTQTQKEVIKEVEKIVEVDNSMPVIFEPNTPFKLIDNDEYYPDSMFVSKGDNVSPFNYNFSTLSQPTTLAKGESNVFKHGFFSVIKKGGGLATEADNYWSGTELAPLHYALCMEDRVGSGVKKYFLANCYNIYVEIKATNNIHLTNINISYIDSIIQKGIYKIQELPNNVITTKATYIDTVKLSIAPVTPKFAREFINRNPSNSLIVTQYNNQLNNLSYLTTISDNHLPTSLNDNTDFSEYAVKSIQYIDAKYYNCSNQFIDYVNLYDSTNYTFAVNLVYR